MRRLLALATLATAVTVAAPANASYTCVPADSNVAVCVQIGHCTDLCFIEPGVYVDCYLGYRGETVCRIVRLLGFEIGG